MTGRHAGKQCNESDKFILGNQDTGLEKMLKDKGINSVIPVGTAAHGAVLYTASAAALRGFNVIVPVDGMSGDGQNTFIEQYVNPHRHDQVLRLVF